MMSDTGKDHSANRDRSYINVYSENENYSKRCKVINKYWIIPNRQDYLHLIRSLRGLLPIGE